VAAAADEEALIFLLFGTATYAANNAARRAQAAGL
jgi:hypothetical protein